MRLMTRPLHLVFTLHHSVDEELDPKTKLMRPLVVPNLPPALNTFVCGMTDAVVYTFMNGQLSGLCQESVTEKRHIFAKTRNGLKLGNVVALDALATEILK